MSTTPTGPEWRLWADWCAAFSVAPLDADTDDVLRFLSVTDGNTATRKRRARVIVSAHQAVGNPISTQPTDSQSRLWSPDDQLLTLPDALAALSIRGWPNGLRARRDGWVLVLAAAGFSRQDIRTMTVADISTHPLRVAGISIEAGGLTDGCAACAATGWLHIAAVYQLWGRRSARIQLADQLSTTPTHAHVCYELLIDGWHQIRQLAPAIDRYGWLEDRTPMSTRAITRVVNVRRDTSGADRALAHDSLPAPQVDQRFNAMGLDLYRV